MSRSSQPDGFDDRIQWIAGALAARSPEVVRVECAAIKQLHPRDLADLATTADAQGPVHSLDARFTVLLGATVSVAVAAVLPPRRGAGRVAAARQAYTEEVEREATKAIIRRLVDPRAERFGWTSWLSVEDTVRETVRGLTQ